jgi:hypothetical protein
MRASSFHPSLHGLKDVGVHGLVNSQQASLRLRRRRGSSQSACPIQASPDQASCLVKLGPAGDC